MLVTNSTFPADAYNLPDLEGPRNDPALLRDALCDPDVGMFAPDNVRLVTADRLRSTAVKASDLRGMMDASAAGVTVVVVDCCHSGRFKGTNVPETLSGRGRFIVTSSRPASWPTTPTPATTPASSPITWPRGS